MCLRKGLTNHLPPAAEHLHLNSISATFGLKKKALLLRKIIGFWGYSYNDLIMIEKEDDMKENGDDRFDF